MKKSYLVFALLLPPAVLASGVAEPSHRIGGQDYCVPDQFVVRAIHHFVSVGGDGPSDYLMLEVPGEVVAQVIPGFREFVDESPLAAASRNQPSGPQPMTVSVRDGQERERLRRKVTANPQRFVSAEPSFDERAGLSRLTQRPSPQLSNYAAWLFVNAGADGRLDLDADGWFWGSCHTHRRHAPTDYECTRTLLPPGMTITYTLRGENIQHYQAVDALILQRLEDWRCD